MKLRWLLKTRLSATASSAWFDDFRYNSNIRAVCPPNGFPERNAICIVIENKDVAFVDVWVSQGCQTTVNESTANALPAVVGMNCQMMNVSAPTIVSGQDYAYNFVTGSSNEAHPRVTIYIRLDIFSRISIAQADSPALLPQGEYIIVGFYFKLWDIDIHHLCHQKVHRPNKPAALAEGLRGPSEVLGLNGFLSGPFDVLLLLFFRC